MGNKSDILKAIKIIENSGAELGLYLNLSKCELISSSQSITDEFPQEIKRIHGGFDLLGSPIGKSDFKK
ncbi:MAG: hypothetical protein GY928_09175 [Colwellia sp.]|nr:hypothetical protein [Colwellia sp.]